MRDREFLIARCNKIESTFILLVFFISWCGNTKHYSLISMYSSVNGFLENVIHK